MTRLTRALVRFQQHPSSVRYAAAAIVSTIAILVVAGALLIQLLAPEQFPGFGDAIWFTLQTVTTVGYGDITPTSGVGRLVASVVMLVSISLLTVITAGVTSMFIRALARPQDEADHATTTETLTRLEALLVDAHQRLDHIEQIVASSREDRRAD